MCKSCELPFVTSLSSLSSKSSESMGNDIFYRFCIFLSESDLAGSLCSLLVFLRLNTLYGRSVFGGWTLYFRFDFNGMFGDIERFVYCCYTEFDLVPTFL